MQSARSSSGYWRAVPAPHPDGVFFGILLVLVLVLQSDMELLLPAPRLSSSLLSFAEAWLSAGLGMGQGVAWGEWWGGGSMDTQPGLCQGGKAARSPSAGAAWGPAENTYPVLQQLLALL